MAVLPADATARQAAEWHKISVHEIGHTLIGSDCGIPIHEVKLRFNSWFGLAWSVSGRTEVAPNGGTVYGYTSHAAAFIVGGLEAEAMWLTAYEDMSLRSARRAVERRYARSEDMAELRDCLTDPDLTLTYADFQDQINARLTQCWEYVEAAAGALCLTGHLSGADLAHLI